MAEVATSHGSSGRWGSRENTEERGVGYQFGYPKVSKGRVGQVGQGREISVSAHIANPTVGASHC